MNKGRLFTVPEAAEHLHISEKTIRRMVQDGSLPHRRVGNQLRFSGSDFETVAPRRLSLPVSAATPPASELSALSIPDWAESRVRLWRLGLQRLMLSHEKLNVIVMDRRGAKTFRILGLDEFSWGKNLWHSNAIESLADSQLRKQFAGAEVVIFDEMIQHGRKMALLRGRLEALDISVHTVCLIRRRSYFLDGKIHDPQVQAVEDLDDDAFARTATFLSRLLARRAPPMDVEHVVVVGHSRRNPTTSESVSQLTEFAETEVVWLSERGKVGAVDAVTLDRPFFFDPGRLQLPEGIAATWDGPLKIRGYYDQTSMLLVLVFIAFPKLEGSIEAWARLVQVTKLRYGSKSTDSAPSECTDNDVEQAYADVCTDASMELLRQAISAGLLMSVGLAEVDGLAAPMMCSIFGPKRGKRLAAEIRTALRPIPGLNLFAKQQQSIPTCIDLERNTIHDANTVDARKLVLERVKRRWETSTTEPEGAPISFPELIRSTAPIDERAISIALDYELDVGTVQPTQRVERLGDDRLRVERAYWRGEYEGEYLTTYDEESTRRSRVICANALGLWLEYSGRRSESELTVAKLFANLVHDWGEELPALDFGWKPYKHGAVPCNAPDSRYLIPVLAREHWLDNRSVPGEHRRYTPGTSPWSNLFRAPLCPGSVTARVRGLIRAYWAIQQECVHGSPSDDLSLPRNPLVVLASARNEKTAYRCARFELVYWIRTGYQSFFPVLMDAVALDCSSRERVAMLRKSVEELAQAAKFLHAKLNMYRDLPTLRNELAGLFARNALDSGDIILETVDAIPRFSHSFNETEHPVGLLQDAADIVKPFTSFLRQILTLTDIDVDRRRPADRQITLADGTKSAKDAAHYLGLLLQAAPEIARSIGPTLELAILQAQTARQLDGALVQRLHSAFVEIVKLLKLRIRDLEGDGALDERRRKLEQDLVRVPRRLAEKFKAGYVAVGDFYNFKRFIMDPPPPYVSTDLQTRAEKVQAWMLDVGERASKGHPSVSVMGLHGDTIILAGQDVAELVLSAMTFCKELRSEHADWDRQIGANAVDFMRFGVAKFDDTADGPTAPLSAVMQAFATAERHGQPRGTVGITRLVHNDLPESMRRYFTDGTSSAKDERQGPVSSWRADTDTVADDKTPSVAS